MVKHLIAFALVASLIGCKGSEESSDKTGDETPDKTGDKTPDKTPNKTPDKTGDKTPGEKDKPPVVSVVPGSVRVAVTFTDELLKSEARAISAAAKALKKSKLDVTIGNAGDDEKAAAEGYFKGEPPATLPPTWMKIETVVVLSVLPPSGKKPKRLSRGLGHVLVLRPPAMEPVYLETVDGDAGNALSGKELASWVTEFIAATSAEEGSE